MNISKLLMVLLISSFALGVSAQKTSKAPKPDKPFKINERGMLMTKVDVRREERGTENIIQIEALNVSGGTALVRGPIFPGAVITDVMATQGSYNMTRQISKSGRGETIQILNVVFPIRLRVTVSNQILDVEIKEEGFWKIAVGVSQ